MLDGWRAAEVAPEVQRIAQWAAGSGANLLPVGERFPGELAELAARSTDHSADDSAGQLANKQAQVSGLDKRQRQRQRERERLERNARRFVPSWASLLPAWRRVFTARLWRTFGT